MANEDAIRQTAAAQLRAGARALAAGAAETLLDEVPEIGAKHGTGAYSLWHGFLTQRVVEIATAVELDEPGLFTTEIRWLYSTLSAREISPAEVRRSIACLEQALRDDLPDAVWRAVEPTLEQALDAAPMEAAAGSRIEADRAEAELSASFLRATLGGDAGGSTGLILDAFRGGVEASALYERVMLPVQAEIGALWQRGELGIADEHVATELIRASMTALWLAATGGASGGAVAVVGSVTGDQHDAGVRATAHILDINGLRGVCLGCDVPAEEFGIAATRFEAVGAVVSASMSVHLPRVKQSVGTLKGVRPELRIVVGGPAFGMDDGLAERLAMKFGADGYARTPSVAATLIGSAG